MCLSAINLRRSRARWVQAGSPPRTARAILFFLLSFSLWLPGAFAQNGRATRTVTGRVLDEKSAPLAGASVKPTRSRSGVATDADGYFKIEVRSGDVLEISYVGKTLEKIAVGDDNNISVVLKNAANSDLNDVVVTGYMTQKKADLTGAVAVVSAQALMKSHGTTNIAQSLQGVVPGMHVTADGSPAGGNVNIQVRGLTSINGGSPLIVIDGVPSYLDLRDINPDNIASMQVLKDAYSTSIYGTQGGAGVILIQTKKGLAGPGKISYIGSVGFSQVAQPVKLLNTQQYGQALWQASVNGGQDPNLVTQIYKYDWNNDFTNPVLNSVTPIKYMNADSTMISGNTNWLNAISQNGLQTDHQLTISGGHDKATSLFSVNYFDNKGTQLFTEYQRFSVRLNTDYKVIKDHFTIGENLEASHMKINDQNVMHDAMVEPSIIPVHTTDGGWGGSAVALGMDDYWNPVRELTLNKDNGTQYNKIVGDIHANIMFLNHFTFHSQLGLLYTDGYHRTIQFTFQEGGGKFNPISSVDQYYWRETTLDLTNTLTYHLSKGKHNLDVLAGMEANRYSTETMDANRQTLQFQNYDYAYLSTATGNMSMSGGGDMYNLLSYFGKFNYSYKSRYLLSASMRYDGSSKFGESNQFALFPAVSAGWRLSQESFLVNSTVVSDLKLRASWGRNGNLANISSLASQTYFGSSYNYTSYGISGAESGSLPSGFYRIQTGNENLRWETTSQTNIGVDFGFLNQKIFGSIDAYRKYTSGMLIQPPYLGTLGEGAYQYINAADMTNKGVELSIGYHGDLGKSFGYTITGNIAYNKNVVNDLPVSVQYSWGGSALKGDGIAGHPWGSYYGFIADGLFKSQSEVDNSPTQPGKGLGRIRYRDLSGAGGKPDGNVDYDYDRTWIGNGPTPTTEYGFSVSLTYKNFDFFMFWQGIAGVKVYDGWKTYSDFWNVWVQNGFNHPTRVLDAWTPQNPNSTIPALSLVNANDELRTSTYFIEPGWYLKMRNIQLGYNFPKPFRSKVGMERFYMFVSCQNLLNFKSNKFTAPDPETPDGSSYSNPYVMPRVWKVGLEVSL